MASFTSESDPTHLQARRCSVICHTIFFSLTTDIVSQNPLVPAALQKPGMYIDPGSMATLREGDQWQMWEFIRI